MFKGIFNDIKEWIVEAAKTCRREFSLVFTDVGVLIFFFVLPLAYPVIYALIYNPEVTRDMPVAVVDNCRTAQSREFIRHADATEAIKICGYAANMEEAKEWWKEKKCFAVIEIPENYTRQVVRGEQGVIQFNCDASLLLRYRTFLQSLTDLQMQTDSDLRTSALALIGAGSMGEQSSIGTEAYFLGDPQQGFASFIMPGVIVLILQQSMILGIVMLGGTANDRRRLNGGIDPRAVQASPSAAVIGKSLCYVMIYLPLTFYILHFIPEMFAFPHIGEIADYLLFILPMLLASAMLGLTLQILASERETSFVIVVFTSVAFLFLSGLTWPRFAMPDIWLWLSNLVPATWGIEGFIRINNNGSTLALQHTPYHWLWILTAAYFVTAYLVNRYQNRHA